MCAQKHLRVVRLTMIESAEDISLWLKRVQEQWCTKNPIAVRINSGNTVLGSTVPIPFEHHTQNGGWWGFNWDTTSEVSQDENITKNNSDCQVGGHTFTISEEQSTLLALDIMTLTGKIVAIGLLNIQSAFVEEESVQLYRVSLVPESCAVDDSTVHAVLEVEVFNDDETVNEQLEGDCKLHGIPTSIHCGVVEISTTQFFFPSCFLTGNGAFVVSNVLCVKNINDETVSVQLVVTGDTGCIHVQPPGKISLEANEKAYFVATWDVFKKFASTTKQGVPIGMHLMLSAGGEDVKPVTIQVLGQPPHASSSNTAFHYWVNTTPITNRTCSVDEFTKLRTLLPVFQLGKPQ